MNFQAILHNISYISPITPNSFVALQILLNNHANMVRGYKRDILWLLLVYHFLLPYEFCLKYESIKKNNSSL